MRDDWKSKKISTKFANGVAVPVTVGILIFGICITIAVLIVMFKPNGFAEAETILKNEQTNTEVVEENAEHSEASEPPDLAPTGESKADQNGHLNNEIVSKKSILFVHVTGQVKQPGVVEVAEGSRVIDAIDAAGGVLEAAVTGAINLARPVTDGEQVFVPDQKDLDDLGDGHFISENIVTNSIESSDSVNIPININQANAEQLQKLSGIGPAIASKIISWRESNGNFTVIEDLMHVSGIGPKMFEKLIDQITV